MRRGKAKARGPPVLLRLEEEKEDLGHTNEEREGGSQIIDSSSQAWWCTPVMLALGS
jgi:hypothetical protein